MGRMVQEGGGGSGEKDGIGGSGWLGGATDGTPRCEGRRLPRVGGRWSGGR